MTDLYKDLVSKLELLFGKFDEENKKFPKAPNSEVARELGYSDAQFSRLINQHATEGEYQRANKNAERILTLLELENRLKKVGVNPKQALASPKKRIMFLIVGLIVGSVSAYLLFFNNENIVESSISKYDMLRWSFETSYVKPYVNLNNLPEDCNFPCYKYQGKWELKDPYKIPFFREQNGYHYAATEVIMYARCITEEAERGSKFEGYEYQKHEIWYDKRELPVDSFIYTNGNIKEAYQKLDFKEDDNFIKVATVHTFFRNEFVLEGSVIARTGKVIGRDLEMVTTDELSQLIQDRNKLAKIESNINRIASNRLEDFSRPISCDKATAPEADFNMVKDGDLISFDCRLTTSRVSLDYVKTYILEDQYIKNTCRASDN
ncbi:hypothetical protein [Fulvivirga lutea]|uniref:Uncharacterized protein n=1 Tax=Fulvivirga lutea TaxID=2810512 RepID=A0A974WK88_9BACT|nr:hypothetical protein [Fulvivirga lutea]QSE98752.1 hypothetical protein JR347_06640 [Fulvivirga lutea]